LVGRNCELDYCVCFEKGGQAYISYFLQQFFMVCFYIAEAEAVYLCKSKWGSGRIVLAVVLILCDRDV